MTTIIQQPELQKQTLRLYGEFVCRRENWAGRLALAAFAGAGSSGFAAAASLAGASSLTVDSDADVVKAHFRDGAFDFVVNTLDEALRAIKNEIRQGRSIAIGLIAEPADALAEAAERGLAAAFVLCESGELYAAVSDSDVTLVELDKPSQEFCGWLSKRRWSAVEVDIKNVDAAVRLQWLRNLPAHQRSVRQGNRWMWLSPNETLES